MNDKRYDGAKELSNLSGLPKTQVLSIWEEVKVNHAKLHACPRHRFPLNESVKMGQKFICLECGGQMDLTRIGQYIAGYQANGGNPDDIWPGYCKP